MWLNADCPVFECLVRAEYLYDGRSHRGEFVPAYCFGVASIEGRALGFHVMTQDTGAVVWRLPISALVHEAEAPELPLDFLQLWDCFSYRLSVHAFAHLAGRSCMAILKDRSKRPGRYLFTVDWFGSAYAESAGDGGHKCAHVLALDCGCYAALPNNRILWADPATIDRPFASAPKYLTNTRIWRVEHDSKWVTTGDGWDMGERTLESEDATDEREPTGP